MSRGIGAHANKVAEDENTVIYEYGSYNWNDPKYRNEDHLYDGTISILRDCFAEPDIYEKVKKMPSWRKKLIVKRIPVDVEYGKMLEDGRIIVENCSNCWQTTANDLLTGGHNGLPLAFLHFPPLSGRRKSTGVDKL